MTRYWLDASVFIEAQNVNYPMDTVPSYWKWIAGKVADGTIVCPKLVYREIVDGLEKQDALAKWFQTRKQNGLCIAPDKAVTDQVGIISKYVFAQFKQHQATNFLRGADSWIIAHAHVDKGIVVTQESSLRPNSHKPRIPDVCRNFNLACMNGIQMMKKLKAQI